MSPLTPDERAEVADFLRGKAHERPRLMDLADKLEAEPEPAEWTCTGCGAAGDRQSCRECGAECRPVSTDTVRERDEAREALRDLLDWAENIEGEGKLRRTEALRQARAVLEGVERTHALVPVEALQGLADAIDESATLPSDSTWRLVVAARQAARGETPSWPGVASLADESGQGTGMPETQTLEWRAVGYDKPQRDHEAGHERSSWTTEWEEADKAYTRMRDLDEPPFDDVWIEQRTVTATEPERVTRKPGASGEEDRPS